MSENKQTKCPTCGSFCVSSAIQQSNKDVYTKEGIFDPVASGVIKYKGHIQFKNRHGGFCVTLVNYSSMYEISGSIRKTHSGAIKAWNKMWGK